MIRSTTLLAAVVALGASAASAATFMDVVPSGSGTFDGGQVATSFTATVSGVGVTVTGGSIRDDLTNYVGGGVGYRDGGFGVNALNGVSESTGPHVNPVDGLASPFTIDGVTLSSGSFALNEQLTLTFGAEVVLSSLTFGLIDLFDDATIRVDGGEALRFGFGGDESLNAGGIVTPLIFDTALQGTVFDIIAGYPNQTCTITAHRSCGGATDIFSLTGAELALANQPEAVPLPAGGLLLLSGLAAAGGLARRRKG